MLPFPRLPPMPGREGKKQSQLRKGNAAASVMRDWVLRPVCISSSVLVGVPDRGPWPHRGQAEP